MAAWLSLRFTHRHGRLFDLEALEDSDGSWARAALLCIKHPVRIGSCLCLYSGCAFVNAKAMMSDLKVFKVSSVWADFMTAD